ncbi:MAG: hypothetical protein F6K11_36115 [Leptolyngbya sp. SIO3F4]|nr:hypothetical protein [Leptolyngbya sp. SIO3F4]
MEPLTGNRLAQVHARRTKREYTLFFQALAAQYPEALKIQLVQDNLNTHNASSFMNTCPLRKPSPWLSGLSFTTPPSQLVGST